MRIMQPIELMQLNPTQLNQFIKRKSFLKLSGHFGTIVCQDSSVLNYSAEVSGHFGTGAEVSDGHFGIGAEVSQHFGTDLYETLRHHCIFV